VKAKLKKYLRGCRAHFISSIDEPIIGILPQCDNDSNYEPLQYGILKGWLRKELVGKYMTYFFTEKGKVEILEDIQNTCISGRICR
jgi:hypothetical protein